MAVNLVHRFDDAAPSCPDERRWGRVVHVAATAALTGYATLGDSRAKVGCRARGAWRPRSRRRRHRQRDCPASSTKTSRECAAGTSRHARREPAAAKAELAAFSPQRRLVHPDEVAAMVAYLVSDAAAAIHGQALALDGGETTL